ncbi:hypothetical protein [Ornithinimicrobium kibberense]|uniref:hypothetical protein n=1 Tax=Ornithinimicrobium kibberense TaxID=282060 RepID=UPI003611579C
MRRPPQREQAHVVGVVAFVARVVAVALHQQAGCQGQPSVVVAADVEDHLGGPLAQLDGRQAGAGDQLHAHAQAPLQHRPGERPHVPEGELGGRVVAVGQPLRGDVQLADRGPVDGLDPGAGPRAGQVAPGDARPRPASAAPQASADRPHDEPGRLVPDVPARGQAQLQPEPVRGVLRTLAVATAARGRRPHDRGEGPLPVVPVGVRALLPQPARGDEQDGHGVLAVDHHGAGAPAEPGARAVVGLHDRLVEPAGGPADRRQQLAPRTGHERAHPVAGGIPLRPGQGDHPDVAHEAVPAELEHPARGGQVGRHPDTVGAGSDRPGRPSTGGPAGGLRRCGGTARPPRRTPR